MTVPQAKPILVTGATGKTGRRIVERLTSAGLPVRAGSRRAEPPFDWYDPTTWDSALEGVDSAYISYWPGAARPRPSAPSRPWPSPAQT